jgi:hypothetical protein
MFKLSFVRGRPYVYDAAATLNGSTQVAYTSLGTISFVLGGGVGGCDTITDSSLGFVVAGFIANDIIECTGSVDNDGKLFQIVSVTAGSLDVVSYGDLTPETGPIGGVTISTVLNRSIWEGGGTLDHGSLSGLGDDDHTQYLNATRHNTASHTAANVDHGNLAGLLDDDHTQYRLESADHTHQSTGLQGGKLDHGAALNGLSDDDHTQYLKKDGDTMSGSLLFVSSNAYIEGTAGGLLRLYGSTYIDIISSSLIDTNKQIQFRDSDIHIESGNDGHLDLTADTSIDMNSDVDVSAKNIITDTSTGTKIGTATAQKLGFFNATPVDQPAAVADATGAGDVVAQLNSLLARIRELGLIAT